MLDHFSNYPAPSKKECLGDMIQYIKSKNTNKYISTFGEEYIKEKCQTLLNSKKQDELGSYTGWMVSACIMFSDSILDELDKILDFNFRKRVIKIKIRFIGWMLRSHQRILTRIYAPGGTYFKAIEEKYNEYMLGSTYNSIEQDNDNLDWWRNKKKSRRDTFKKEIENASTKNEYTSKFVTLLKKTIEEN
jgi:hypothetical protein